MWEGWKARGGEATALALTLQKSREASGCPAGVDLQDWVKQLAAENVALKTFCKNAAFDADYEAELGMERGGFTDALNNIETPATDRIVAGIKADGRVEGAHFVANRMLAAWDAGFIEDSAKNAADIARMILTSTEFMADAPEGDFDRSFADGILEDIAKQLREGADK
nr:ead/Ea22-like family protein [Klebsiella aerogenes]